MLDISLHLYNLFMENHEGKFKDSNTKAYNKKKSNKHLACIKHMLKYNLENLFEEITSLNIENLVNI